MKKVLINRKLLFSRIPLRFMQSSSDLVDKIIDGKFLAAKTKETIKANIEKRLSISSLNLVSDKLIHQPCLATL